MLKDVRILISVSAVTCLMASAAIADNTIYKYDALGRVTETFNSNTGFRDQYFLDPADNRSNVGIRNVVFQLQANQTIYSPDNRFRLVMQTDGNLVLYGPSGALWSSSTFAASGNFAAMQADGNFVVYNGSGQALWSSGTSGNPAAELDLQSDGNLVVYNDAGTALWSTQTGGH